jgi:hypothetical protein
MDLDHIPHRSHRLLNLPPHLESFPSKRHKFIKLGTHTSTYHTCDHTCMINESSQKDIGIPSTPIPSVFNGTLLTPSTTMIVVPEVLIITPIQPVVATQLIVTNPFGCLFGMLGYNAQTILLVSNPFSFGMPNMTTQISSSIPSNNINPSVITLYFIGSGGD